MVTETAPLLAGAHVRVVAPSHSLGGIREVAGFSDDDASLIARRFEEMGLSLSFGRHVEECDDHLSAPAAARLEDLHDAFADESVDGVLAASGGLGAIQLIEGLDYGLIRRCWKPLCGYSDVTMLCSAIQAQAGLMTYYGPNYTSFAMQLGFEYTLAMFQRCLMQAAPFELAASEQWSDDSWMEDQLERTFHDNEGPWIIQAGEAEGQTVGGNLDCLNLLQGTKYMPATSGRVLLAETASDGKATLLDLDRRLRVLSLQEEGPPAAVLLGRFPSSAEITADRLRSMINGIPRLQGIPVVANLDFGHTTPAATLPIGGTCRITDGGTRITIERH